MLLWRRWVAEQREEGGGHYAERLLREMAEDAIDFCLASSMYYSVLHALLRLILCHGCRLSVAFHSCTPVARGEWLSVPLRLFDGERSVVRMTFSVALDCRRRDALIEMLCSGTCNRLACLVSACTLLRVASGSTRAIFFFGLRCIEINSFDVSFTRSAVHWLDACFSRRRKRGVVAGGGGNAAAWTTCPGVAPLAGSGPPLVAAAASS